MNVADMQGEATSATLGAQEAHEVGLTDDAAFLIMMSTNLYSNQELAMVREVLCNAWDAHIEAGTTGTPIRVTITSSFELIIEDSGLGIPHAIFPRVYGTIGDSTKKSNLMVTGGFGLGAKSPWAYADSFRVVNEHAGIKTVSNMVKSSIEKGGKPAIQPVVSVPTERTGVTVKIQLEEKDVRVTSSYIRAIAMHGDMLVDVQFGDAPVERLAQLGMDSTPGSYNVDDGWYQHYMGNHSIFVRYGAVIYPMLQTPGTQKAIDLLKEFMELVGFRRMVVQAAPGTLALTPSREALSSSKMTQDGITDLCVALVARIEEDIIKQIPASIMKAVERLSKGEFGSGLELYEDTSYTINPIPVRRYLESQLGATKMAKYQPLLDQAEHRGFKTSHTFTNKAATHQYHKLRRRLKDVSWQNRRNVKHAFAKHYILRPLSRVFLKNPDLLNEKSISHSGQLYTSKDSHNRHSALLGYVKAEKFDYMREMIDKPIVIVTSRLSNLRKSIECCPDVVLKDSVWIYKITPKDSKREAIVKAFQDGGYTVVDLILNHEWDEVAQEREEQKLHSQAIPKAVVTTPTVAVTKAVVNQLMSLSNVFDDVGKRKMVVPNIKLMKDDLETSNKPLFYLPVEDIGQHGRLGRFGHYLDLTMEERTHGVIVRSGVEKNMAIKRGAILGDEYLIKKLWAKIHTKEYETYCTKQRKSSLWDHHNVREEHVELLDYLGIKLPGFNKLILNPELERTADLVPGVLWGTFAHHIPGLKTEELTNYSSVISQYEIEEYPLITKLLDLKKDRMLNWLMRCSDFMGLIKEFPERKAALKSLVMSALNGK